MPNFNEEQLAATLLLLQLPVFNWDRRRLFVQFDCTIHTLSVLLPLGPPVRSFSHREFLNEK